jgi:transposase
MPRKKGIADPRYRGKERKEAARLYRQGLSERAVADRLGMSKTRIRDYLDQMGVERRPVGRPAGAKDSYQRTRTPRQTSQDAT